MPLLVYCSECGTEVKGKAVDSGDLVARPHSDPDDAEEDCPGSDVSAEYASGRIDDDEPEGQESDKYDDDSDLSLAPGSRRRGRPKSVDRDCDLLELVTEPADFDPMNLLP